MHHIKTRSTGTVHAATADGKPLCPIKASTAVDATTDAVTCRRCIAIAPIEEQVTDLHGLKARAASDGQGYDVPALDCQPWCTDHDDCTLGGLIPADPEDGICQRRVTSPAFGEIVASYTKDHGPMVHLYNTRDELTPSAATEFARAILAQVAEIAPTSGNPDTPDERPYTRDAVRLAFYKGVLRGATEPNIGVEDLKAAATEAIENILDERCQHERAVQEEPLALFASGYAACLKSFHKASERYDLTVPQIREFLDDVLTVKERERVGRLVAATLRLREAKTTT